MPEFWSVDYGIFMMGVLVGYIITLSIARQWPEAFCFHCMVRARRAAREGAPK